MTMSSAQRSYRSDSLSGTNDHTEASNDSTEADSRVQPAIPLKDRGSPDTEAGPDSVANEPQRKVRGPAWAILVISLVAANLLYSLDNTIVADVQAPIILDLGDVQKFPWISTGFALGAAATNLFWGQLHKLFDKKLVFLSTVVIFEVGSIVCGVAKSLDTLIVGRVICGIGGTGLFMSTMTIVSALSLPKERALYVSFPGAAWAIGAIIGPVIGGAISDSAGGWRWCFWLNLIYGGVWLPIYVFLLPSIPSPFKASVAERVRRLDFLGFFLWAGALCCLVSATALGGSLFPWGSSTVIGLYIGSGVGWAAFLVQQIFTILTTKDDRLFPAKFLKSWEMCILFVQMAAAAGVLFISIYFIPLYFQFVQNFSSLDAGVHLLPFLCPCIFILIVNGAVMGKTGLYMPWYLVGSALVIVAAALWRTVDVSTSTGNIAGYCVILGVGLGCYVQASFAIAQAKAPAAEIPIAVAFITCAQITSQVLSFAISYSVFMNTATNQIASILPNHSTEEIQEAITGVGAPIFASLSATTKAQILDAINNSVKNAWAQVLAAGGLSFVLAIVMKRERITIKK